MRIHLMMSLSMPLLVAAGAFALGSGGCTVNNTTVDNDGGAPGDDGGSTDTDATNTDASDTDAGSSMTTDSAPAEAGQAEGGDAAGEAGAPSPLPFAASNINWAGIDVSMVADQDISTACDIQTGKGAANDCFPNMIADTVVTQSDQSELHVYVVKSLKLEPTAIITITGGLPLAIVSLGDITIAASANITVPPGGAGGFSATASASMGGGPGGGAGGTTASGTPGTGAGGGSYCGQGGQGGQEMGGTIMPGAKTAAYGTPALVPLLAGSSGGNGDTGGASGGGALQLVAGGTFSMGAGSWITVGGAGGNPGGTTGQGANGAGSGGAILIEAVSVNIAGILAANGGGGGGGAGTVAGNTTAGANGTPNATAAAGGASATGGTGSAGTTIDGASAGTPPAAGSAGGGGGGAGRIRINSMSGTPNLTGATLSPDKTTACATSGVVTAK